MILRKAKRFNLLHLRCIEMYPYESPPPSLHCHGSGGGGLVAKMSSLRVKMGGIYRICLEAIVVTSAPPCYCLPSIPSRDC